MDLGSIMLREVSQMEKDKYCMTSLKCGIPPENRVKIENKNPSSQVQRIDEYMLEG